MVQYDFSAKRAVITGGARGIGNAIARRLARGGAEISLWDYDADALQAATLSVDKEPHRCLVDVSDPEQVAAAAEKTLSKFGGVDILVNNAGIVGPSVKSWDCPVEEWQRVMNIDLDGVFYVSRALVPQMMDLGWGRIVNVASVAGKEGNPNAAPYSTAKAGVIGFTKSLGKETVGTGVLVNCVTPAVVDTDMLADVSPEHLEYMRAKIPMGRLGEAEEVAALVTWLASEDCTFSTGGVFDISGGRATY